MIPAADNDDDMVTTGVHRPAPAFSAREDVQPLPGPRTGRPRSETRTADTGNEDRRPGSVFSVNEGRQPLPRYVEEPAA